MNDNRIINVDTPTLSKDATPKGYVDSRFGGSTLDLATLGDGQIVRWNNGATKWENYTLPTALPPTGSAGGSLTGSFPNPTIAAGAVDTAELAADAVTTAKIEDGTIVAADVAADAVTTAKILDSNVTSAKIAADTIVAADIATGAVESAEVLDGTIAAADLAADSVTTAKILDSNVTSAKIAANTIVLADIATTVLDQNLTTSSDALFDTVQLALSADTCTVVGDAGKMRYNAGNLQYCNGSSWQTLGLSGSAITALTGDVTASGTGSVAATIAADAVTSAKIAADTIVAADIATGAVESAEIRWNNTGRRHCN